MTTLLDVPQSGVRVASRLATLPWASALVVLVTLLVGVLPGVGEALQLDARIVVAGELWRLLGAHFVHWSSEHLLWDLAVFAAVAFSWERVDGGAGRTPLVRCIVVSAIAISAAMLLVPGQPAIYRGLSGVDSALFVGFSLDMLRRARRAGQSGPAAVFALLLVGFTLKITYEALSGSTLFVDAASSGFVPVPLAHLVGGLVGALQQSGDSLPISRSGDSLPISNRDRGFPSFAGARTARLEGDR